VKAKAREEEHLPLLNVYVVIGYNFKLVLPYSVPNKVGKMTTKCYIEQILPRLLLELTSRGLTLCHDADSAHTSKGTQDWCKQNGLLVITLPGVSPDFSIFETLAHPVKQKFHKRRVTSEKDAFARFERIWHEETDQKSVQKMYKWYTKRLHECKRANGQMTRY
jgi:hypothetical protein